MGTELTESTPVEMAVVIWANAKTGVNTARRQELISCKRNILLGFFGLVDKHPLKVQPADVLRWQHLLETEGLAHSTIYSKLCHLSSFYDWLGAQMGHEYNPVNAVRPKAPDAYGSDTVKALTRQQVRRLLRVVRHRSEGGSIVARRDYALLLFYFATGLRRSEIIGLRWGDIVMTDEEDAVRVRVKGGRIETVEVADQRVWHALFNYLEASNRLSTIQGGDPLWSRHDNASRELHDPLTSHGFVKNLKEYAKEADVPEMHLHRTRHTYARQVVNRDGLSAAQEGLGHASQATTRIYTGRLTTRRDRFSTEILDDVL